MNKIKKESRFVLGFIRDGDSLLLIKKKRGLGKGYYNGFGGKVEEEESYEEALRREAGEELGIKVKNYELVAVLHFIDTENFMICPVYLIKRFEGTPKESKEAKPGWFTKDKIPYSQMWADDKHWLPKVLNGKKVYGRFVFDDILAENSKLIDFKVKLTSQLEQYKGT